MKKILEKLRSNPIYKKYEMFMPPIICGLIVLLLLITVIVPNILQYIETNKKIAETEDKLAFFQEKEALLKSVNKEEYTEGVNRSFTILPTDKEAPAAIAQLYYILGLTSMSVENISFSDAGSSTDGKSFKIALEIKGGLSSLTGFILELKKAPRIMRINSLEVNAPASATEVLASITIDAFYEPLPATISSIDQPIKQPTASDLEILNKLATSSFPNVGAEQNFSGPKGKPNPFE